MGFEPKPPQGVLPVWIGGNSDPAFRRIGQLGDGWLASQITDAEVAAQAIGSIRRHAEEAGRDPMAIGLQAMVAPPPRPGDENAKLYYADHDEVARRVGALREMGFQYAAINATAIFQAGARGVDPMIDALGKLHDRLRKEVGT